MVPLTFTVEAHPTDPTLVIYRGHGDGAPPEPVALPADSWQTFVNASYLVTDLRSGQVVQPPAPLAPTPPVEERVARVLATAPELGPATRAALIAALKGSP